MRRWLIALVQLGVSIALVAALIWFADWDALKKTAATLSYVTMAALFLVNVAAMAALVLRWRAMVDVLGVRETWLRSWHAVFAGNFLNSFLPATLGSDGLRIVLLTRASGQAAQAIGAIAYERLMQLALYLMLMAGAAILAGPWLPLWLRALIIVAGVFGVVAMIGLVYWLGRRSGSEGEGRPGLFWRIWRLVTKSILATGRMHHLMLRHPRAAWLFWFGNLMNAVLIYAVCWMILDHLGEEVAISTIVLGAAAAAIATAAPISLGGVGVYEVVLVAILGLAGVPASHAVLMALIKRCVSLAVSLAGAPSAHALWRERKL